jgi:hypothetical protein
VFVDELDGHRSFSDGGGAAFGRAGADVAGGEDAGNACLEQVVGTGCVAGEDEAVGGACDRVVKPLGARLRAEEEEEEGRMGGVGSSRSFSPRKCASVRRSPI